MLPRTAQEYKSREYWDSRFEEEDKYEWLGSWEESRDTLLKYTNDVWERKSKMSKPNLGDDDVNINDGEKGTIAMQDKYDIDLDVLVVGCGNSDFSESMRLDLMKFGQINVTNTDFSQTVIDKMRKKYPDMNWVVDDMTRTKLDDESFDIVFDKGAMDCLVQNPGDPWNPNVETKVCTKSMVKSIHKVLRNGGKYLQVSFQQPHFRKHLLTQVPGYWENEDEICVENLEHVGLGYFIYVMEKAKMK